MLVLLPAWPVYILYVALCVLEGSFGFLADVMERLGKTRMWNPLLRASDRVEAFIMKGHDQ